MARPGVASMPLRKYGQTPLESPSLTGLPGPPTPLESGSRDPIGASLLTKTARSIGAGPIHRSPSGLGVAVLPAGRFALLTEPNAASGGAEAHGAKLVARQNDEMRANATHASHLMSQSALHQPPVPSRPKVVIATILGKKWG